MRIAVIGTDHVGLVTAACLADTGSAVVAVGESAIPFEPGLAELVARNVADQRLRFESDLPTAVAGAQVVFVAALDRAQAVAVVVEPPAVLALLGAVPVGATRRLAARCQVACIPLFLERGAALDGFQRPDRVVVGADGDHAKSVLAELFAPFVRTEKPILFMDPTSAEMTCAVTGVMLVLRSALMNHAALVCERVGADVEAVRRGVGADARIGHAHLAAGVGEAMPDVAAALDDDEGLMRAAAAVDARQRRLLVDRARAHFGALAGRRIAVWGLAAAPRTDDMRDAPSRTVVEGLLAEGARVAVHDPAAMNEARRIFGERIEYCDDPYAAARGADALLLVTAWNEFRRPDLERLRAEMRAPVVLDGRNIYDPARMRALGFVYSGVGRP